MPTNRDNFTADTIRRAAGRVAYRCSFPGCNNSTIGASYENEKAVSITGVAAHICAAAKGGKRYDETMTESERKSINNCIWMCQTHAHLIDTDATTYTVETLRQWKKDAEKLASKALADADFLNGYYGSNGENLDDLQYIFDGLIIDGQFKTLQTILRQYNNQLSEKYEELVTRYRVIYDVYCSRSSLQDDLEKYCQLSCKFGSDSLIELFFTFLMVDELNKVVEYGVNEDLLSIANILLNGELEENLFVPIGTEPQYAFPAKYMTTISKTISNLIVKSKRVGTVDQEGKKIQLYSEEFYYQIIASAIQITDIALYHDGKIQDIIYSEGFSLIKENITKIKYFDPALQLFIWDSILFALTIDKEQFDRFYELCPDSIKNEYDLKRVKFLSLIYHAPEDVSVDELLAFSEECRNYNTLCAYLSQVDPASAISYLEDHRFLYSRSSAFLHLRLIVFSHFPLERPDALLEQFDNCYCNDNMYHCLCAKFYTDDEKKTRALHRLNSQINMDGPTFFFYLRILSENHEWAEIASLSGRLMPNECRYRIAYYLAQSNQKEYLSISGEIYDALISFGRKRQWLHFNRGITHYHLGEVEAAKKCYHKEYDEYAQEDVLYRFLELRYETNEIKEDKYLHDLESLNTAQSQCLIGAFYLKMENYPLARKFYLRSLLIDEHNNLPSINGYCHACRRLIKKPVDYIQADVVCTIKNETKTMQIALHAPNIIENIAPNGFANCKHYSCEDSAVSSLMFCKVNESVRYQENFYLITEIINVDDVLMRYAFSVLIESPSAMKFSSSSPEELLDIITPIMRASTDNINKCIDEYNSLEVRLPISLFSKQVGRDMLPSCEFLAFQNKQSIRNNLAVLTQKPDDFVFALSYDSIVFLVHGEVEQLVKEKFKLICASQVKRQLLSDIDAEFAQLKAGDSPGSLVYIDDRVSFLEYTAEMKRVRYGFLTRLKEFVNSIEHGDSYDFFCIGTIFQEIFSEHQIYCEAGTLGLAQNLSNVVVVTDDQFLFAISTTMGIPNIGLTSLLANSGAKWSELLRASKQLVKLNFINYLPLELYQSVVDSLIECGEIETGSQEIFQFLQSDTNLEPSARHRDIIISLYSTILQAGLEYLNPNNILAQLSIQFYEKNNPGYIEMLVDKAWQELSDEMPHEQEDV